MLIAAEDPASTPAWRDQLALWSDILGVVGFLISIAGLAVGLWVNKQVREARDEAKRVVMQAEIRRLQSELAMLCQSLYLAREAGRGKVWMRMLGHIDVATDWATRLVNRERISASEQQELALLVDNLSELGRVLLKRKTESHLSQDRLDLLDQTIRLATGLDARMHSRMETEHT